MAPGAAQFLRDAIHAYNEERTGYRNGASLSCFVRDSGGNLVAGIDGFTWGGYARIEYLWVEQSRRRPRMRRANVGA